MKFKKDYLNHKIQTTLVLLFAIFAAPLFGQQTTFSDSWNRHGISLQSQDNQSVELNFSIDSYTRQQMDINGEQMEKPMLQGSFLPNNEGSPDLPAISRYIAVPQGATVKVNITNSRVDQVNNINISPAPRIPLDSEKGPLDYKKDNQVYSSNSLYPAKAVTISEPMKIRGLDVVMLSISPFQYNPVTKEMLVNRDLQIEVEFVGGNGHFGEDKYRNRFWDPILRDAVINDESISFDYKKANRSKSVNGCEYLIITPDDAAFQSWADTIRVFRQKQGIITKVVTISEVGGNTTAAIESYVNDAYNNWDIPPAAVLILADYGTSGVGITSPIYDNYCISDNIFSDVDGDMLPEITFARMTARNAAELETLVLKAINYERNPPTNPGFYNNPITAMGWQTERWFQLCSEVIAGYFETVLEKEPVRENAIYQGGPSDGWSSAQNTSTIINYFGENGLGYIPDSPSYLTDFGGNATRINNDINAGAFLLQHRDHGGVTLWGEPSYNNSNIAGTLNTDLTFIFSINCLTGKFNAPEECFVERFHRHEFGALGLIGATETSYSFVNDTYVWGAYDYMWPDFMPEEEENPVSRGVLPAFGNVAGKYFLQASSWPYNQNNKAVTYMLFHMHGDAFTQLYYEVPQDLAVNHNDVILSGLDFFTVTANEGAFICLTVGDEIIGTAEATGSPLDVIITPQEPGTEVDIVITKQNYYRYESTVEVIPPNGPYCIYEAHQLNDSLGNDNGAAEFDEIVFISMDVENLGNEDAAGVVVNLEYNNPYYTLVDSTESYDSILTGSLVTRTNAYKIVIADNIPDETELMFDVIAVDEKDSTWTSKMYVTVYAPTITPGEMVIDDSEFGNGDGVLDPGENANIKIVTTNEGHCVINDVLISLVPYNNFITVNSEDQLISSLGFFGDSWVTFNIDVADDAPQAVIAEMHYTATAAGYIVPKVYFPKVGQFIEDWETGGFDKYDWELGGDLPWEITMEYPHSGFYHAISGDIGNQETSELSISYEVMANDVIKFWKKVSTEQDFDELRFYIDGILIDSWSGSSAYSQVEYPVTSGDHTFKWEYAKDYSGTGGVDAVWLDNIELPTMLVTTVFAGPDAESCENADFATDGTATNYNTVVWETSGDGSFDDVNILKTIYTPGENDKLNGNVALTLNITDDEGEMIDEMLLTLNSAPEAPNMPEGPDYIDVFKVLESSYSTVVVEGSIGYFWELWPEEAGELIENSNEATVYWNPDFLGDATLKVSTLNDCGQGDFSEELNIFVDNTVGVDQLSSSIEMNISPNPSNGEFKFDLNTEDGENVNVKMINYLGVTIFELEKVSAQNGFTYYFNNRNLPSGVYLISINKNDKTFSRKVIINK